MSRFKLKALTLRHPWVWAVTHLGKDIENRHWQPYRPTLTHLAIHGGATPTKKSLSHFWDDLDWILERFGAHPEAQRVANLSRYGDAQQAVILPGIRAVFPFRGIVESSDSPWFMGTFGWRLEDGLVLPEPVQTRGMQGLWDVPKALETNIVQQIHAALNPPALFAGAL